MTLSAHDVAAQLRLRLPDVGELKLQKLLYYCQGHHLATFGRPLFSEPISAWDKGPVVESLWRDKRHGLTPMPIGVDPSNDDLNTIGYVVSRYGNMSGADLERLSHGEAPWRDADEWRQAGGTVEIPNDAIEKYFRKRAEQDARDSGRPAAGVLAQAAAGAEARRSADPQLDDLAALRARYFQERRSG